MGAGELVDQGWVRVSKKRAGNPDITFTDPVCAHAADQEHTRSGGMAVAVYYRVNIYLMTGSAVAADAEAHEPSPLAGSKCSCKWTRSAGPLSIGSTCPMHMTFLSMGW